MTEMYHIGLTDDLKVRYAILPGDPGRVERIANYLEDPRPLAQKREYTSYLGTIKGQEVLVMSTGMGGPSTAIAVEELKRVGVDSLLRVGTCGGIKQEVRAGDLVVAQAAIRMEGTSREYLPIEFPAVADLTMTNCLCQASQDLSARYHVGVVHCKDSFYGQHDPERMPVSYDLLNKWSAWQKAGCLASEMESAALFSVSQVLGLRSACLLHVIWNKDRAKAGLVDQENHELDLLMQVAVRAIGKLIDYDAIIKAD